MSSLLNALAPYQGAALALLAYLVTSLWMGALIAALTALLLRLWKPLGAAARYAVWYVALLAAVLGPLATGTGLLRAHGEPPAAPVARVATTAGTVIAAVPRLAPSRAIAVPPLLADGAAALWLLVVLVGALRFFAGTRVLARLKRDALPLPLERRACMPLWQAHVRNAHARPSRLCVSDRVDVPVAVGLFDGMVVIPRHVADAFDPGDVDRFVLHELAHLERRDDWTALVQRFVQIVAFFNPAVHVIARRLDLEREIACDDRVIAATSDVRSYAVGLTRMAELTAWPHHAIAAPAIFVTRKQLSLRVEQLRAGRASGSRRPSLVPAAAVFAVVLAVVAGTGRVAPAFALADAGAARSRIMTSNVYFVERDGKAVATMKLDRANTVVIRGDAKTIRARIRALSAKAAASPGGTDARAMHALLDALNARPPGEARVAAPRRSVTAITTIQR